MINVEIKCHLCGDRDWIHVENVALFFEEPEPHICDRCDYAHAEKIRLERELDEDRACEAHYESEARKFGYW